VISPLSSRTYKQSSEERAKNAEYARIWRAKNREQHLEYRREWAQKNPEKVRKYYDDKVAKNPEKYRLANLERNKRYRERLGDEYRERMNLRTRKLKQEVIEAYGGKCSCSGCDETRFEFLTIDHINGRYDESGIKDERSGQKLYNQLKRLNWPTDNYRLLCMNCNFSYGKYGYCPHQQN
jgi:hypothetical protein